MWRGFSRVTALDSSWSVWISHHTMASPGHLTWQLDLGLLYVLVPVST